MPKNKNVNNPIFDISKILSTEYKIIEDPKTNSANRGTLLIEDSITGKSWSITVSQNFKDNFPK